MTRMFMNSRGMLKIKPKNYAATTLDLIQNLQTDRLRFASPDKVSALVSGGVEGHAASKYVNGSACRRLSKNPCEPQNVETQAASVHLDSRAGIKPGPLTNALARRIRRWWNEGALA